MGGLHQVSLGILLGLAPLAYDVFALASHAEWLGKQYWRTTFGFSFPRLRPNAGDFTPPHPVSDADFVQMVTALRVVFPDAPFSLSTREPEELRRRVLPLGFTQMSAGSSTQPGGYGREQHEAEQFAVADKRPAQLVAAELRQLGFEPVWKDWDAGFLPAAIGVAP
jgi:2-iminoacetate synthase